MESLTGFFLRRTITKHKKRRQELIKFNVNSKKSELRREHEREGRFSTEAKLIEINDDRGADKERKQTHCKGLINLKQKRANDKEAINRENRENRKNLPRKTTRGLSSIVQNKKTKQRGRGSLNSCRRMLKRNGIARMKRNNL